MPTVNVSLLEGRTIEAKRKYVTEVTKLTCECFAVPAEKVSVIFNEMKHENHAVAGVLSADKK